MAPVRYNRTVRDAEHSVERFAATGGTGVVLRFAWFYGPDAFQTTDGIALARHGWAPLPGLPDAFVSSVAHDDAAAAVFAALELPAGTYNVTDDNPLSRQDYAAALADILGLPPLRFLPPWTTKVAGSLGKFLTRSERLSNKKLRGASSWSPRYSSVREGLQATVDVLRAREAKALETGNRARI
jgi:2-alkyl-3-oxoalkanoate reductase